MSVAQATIATIRTLQSTLTVLAALDATAYDFPSNCTFTNCSWFDFIVVGGGAAGSVVAGRLSENSNVTVALLETGGYAPLQSEMSGMFPLLPESEYDFKYKSIIDTIYQNHNQSRASVTQGKMLGGSGGLNHLGHMKGDPIDYNTWAQILSDTNWNFTNIFPYMTRSEKLIDPDLFSTPYTALHGHHGPMKVRRNPTVEMQEYLDNMFAELYDVVPDLTSLTSAKGIAQPLYTMDECKRVTAATAYLGPAKNRSNLCVALSTTATKILFNGTTAIGVQVTTSNGDTYVLYANKEVIVTAGGINSAKLLLASGVGPEEDLAELNITVVANLPVGKNLQHHSATLLAYQAAESTAPNPAINYHKFPLPSSVGMFSLNSSQLHPDCLSINIRLPQSSPALPQILSNVFAYTDNITDQLYAASVGREMLVSFVSQLKPTSTGTIKLASTDPTDDPIIDLAPYSNSSDLEIQAQCLANFNRVLNTTYFQNVSAELLDLGLCSNTSEDYYTCIIKALSTPLWDYVGACGMGTVTDNYLKVKDLSCFRVADSSAMPTLTSGENHAAVVMVAEKAVDFIRKDWGI